MTFRTQDQIQDSWLKCTHDLSGPGGTNRTQFDSATRREKKKIQVFGHRYHRMQQHLDPHAASGCCRCGPVHTAFVSAAAGVFLHSSHLLALQMLQEILLLDGRHPLESVHGDDTIWLSSCASPASLLTSLLLHVLHPTRGRQEERVQPTQQRQATTRRRRVMPR